MAMFAFALSTQKNIKNVSQQQAENSSASAGQKSSPVCGRNVPSILSTCPSHLSELKTMNMIVHGGMAASSMSRDVKETKRRGRRLGLLLLGSNGNLLRYSSIFNDISYFYGKYTGTGPINNPISPSLEASAVVTCTA
ncbi:hypothetical protein WN943_029051 [Citrus x changshan-huyou]